MPEVPLDAATEDTEEQPPTLASALPVIAAIPPSGFAETWSTRPPWSPLVLESAGVPTQDMPERARVGLFALLDSGLGVAFAAYHWAIPVNDLAGESRRRAGSILGPAKTVIDEELFVVSVGSELDDGGVVVRRAVMCARVHSAMLVAEYTEQRLEVFDRVAPILAPSILLWMDGCDG